MNRCIFEARAIKYMGSLRAKRIEGFNSRDNIRVVWIEFIQLEKTVWEEK